MWFTVCLCLSNTRLIKRTTVVMYIFRDHRIQNSLLDLPDEKEVCIGGSHVCVSLTVLTSGQLIKVSDTPLWSGWNSKLGHIFFSLNTFSVTQCLGNNSPLKHEMLSLTKYFPLCGLEKSWMFSIQFHKGISLERAFNCVGGTQNLL